MREEYNLNQIQQVQCLQQLSAVQLCRREKNEDINFIYKVLVYQETNPVMNHQLLTMNVQRWLWRSRCFCSRRTSVRESNEIDIDKANGTFTFDFTMGSKYAGIKPSLYYDDPLV